jgi:hypothetical protein
MSRDRFVQRVVAVILGLAPIALITTVTAPTASALGSACSICSPAGVEIAAAAAGGTVAMGAVTVAEVGLSSGTATTIGTGAQSWAGTTAAAVIGMTFGGFNAWTWFNSDATDPLPASDLYQTWSTASPYTFSFKGRTYPNLADSSVRIDSIMTWPARFPQSPVTFCRMPGAAAQSASTLQAWRNANGTTVSAFNTTYAGSGYFAVVSGPGGATGVDTASTGYCTPTQMTAAGVIGSSWGYNSGSRPTYPVLEGIGWVLCSTVSSGSCTSSDAVVAVPPAASPDGFDAPARYIEETVTCKRPGGGTYEMTYPSPTSALVHGGSQLMAALHCDLGDEAIQGSVDVVTPKRDGTVHRKPIVLPQAPAKEPGYNNVPKPCYITTCYAAPNPTTPGVPKITETPPDDPIDPADLPGPAPVDAKIGETDCGLGWSSILDGTIVFKAVGCALSWAFVPSEAALTDVHTQLQTALDVSGMGPWMDSLTGIATDFGGVGGAVAGGGLGGDGGCAGPHYSITLPHRGTTAAVTTYDFDPLNACEDPMKTVAVYIKGLIVVGLMASAFYFLGRPLLAAWGYDNAIGR